MSHGKRKHALYNMYKSLRNVLSNMNIIIFMTYVVAVYFRFLFVVILYKSGFISKWYLQSNANLWYIFYV